VQQQQVTGISGDTAADAPSSAWSPFRSTAFTVLWTATVVSNVGTWMYNAASGWLMTSLDPAPLIVSLVQVANTLPMFLLVLPAGVLADQSDRRQLLIAVQVASTAVAAVFAVFVWLGLITPSLLLLFTFLMGAGAALMAPPWQAVVPQLVPKRDLATAVAANSIGVNVSRAVGPALGGATIATLGIAAPFWINAGSNVAIIAALVWWRSPRQNARALAPERFSNAVIAGVRYASYNRHLRATLCRAVGFYFFASAYWALLPLVARTQISGGPGLYGFMLGAIGTGAVAGSFALPWIKRVLGPDRLVAGGTFSTILALLLFGVARNSATALAASVMAGAGWIAVLASLNVSAQVALPEWVRGRGLAFYMTAYFGMMTAGSALWGHVAGLLGLPAAHFIAAAGAFVAIPMTWRWKLQTGAQVDLTPSMHWPTPVTLHGVEDDRGPVLVTVEYRVDLHNRQAFLVAVDKLGRERYRDGAYQWGVFEDAAEQGRFLETFFVDSWLDHLRQHERVTNADRILQDAVHRYHTSGTPKVSHLIAPSDR
jgi:predicted MFS family arabinose efflux permease